MTTPFYLQLLHAAFTTELEVLTPIVFLILLVGFVVGYLQAATQLEDATLALLPKLLTMVALTLTGAFGATPMLERFAVNWISHAPGLVRLTWN